jgi:hypothetical protein
MQNVRVRVIVCIRVSMFSAMKMICHHAPQPLIMSPSSCVLTISLKVTQTTQLNTRTSTPNVIRKTSALRADTGEGPNITDNVRVKKGRFMNSSSEMSSRAFSLPET